MFLLSHLLNIFSFANCHFLKNTLLLGNLKKEIKNLKKQMKNCKILEISDGVKVRTKGFLCMMDGKCQNAYSNNGSTQRCPLCKLLPAEYMEKTDAYKMDKLASELASEIAGAPLHFGCRSFSHLIKLGALKRAKLKNYRVSGTENKAKYKKAKKTIQNAFMRKKGLRVDFPDKRGGTSTTGNTVRKAFRDPEFMAKTLQLPLALIVGIRDVWIAMRCGSPIYPEKFQEKCDAVLEIYRKKIPFKNMIPSLHKILVHGSLILKLIPEHMTWAMFSEEPLEANNKWIKKWSNQRSRQSSRKLRLSDVFQRQLDRSDPIILSKIANKRRVHTFKTLPPGVLNMLKPHHI